MEYIFGTKGYVEILKTKGHIHTNLTGYKVVVRELGEEKITDSFHIVCKFKSDEDTEGNCYDWYEIDRHYRMIDKTESIKKAEKQNTANIDYISMMTGVELPNEKEDYEHE